MLSPVTLRPSIFTMFLFFFHPRTGFLFFFKLFYGSISLSSHKLLKTSAKVVREHSMDWFFLGFWAISYLKRFSFTSLRSANTTHSHLLSACSMESFMLLSWPYDWFVSLLFMDLCRQMCRIIKTVGKDELFLLRVSYVSIHGMSLVKQ